MNTETIVPIKYIFLDIVGFTHNRSSDTQVQIVGVLNNIVRKSIESNLIPKKNLQFLPTGDGICICLIGIDSLKNIGTSYDAHIRIALDILKYLEDYNASVSEEQHKFQIRIGINQNSDNVVIDINNRKNSAGEGINLCQRIMSLADGNQILVSQEVFSTVGSREKYFHSSFKKLANAKIKHGKEITTYQFIEKDNTGLNIELPQFCKPAETKQIQLTDFAAYYFAHAIKNESFFLSKSDLTVGEYAAINILYFLSLDSIDLKKSKPIDNFRPKANEYGNNLDEQFSFFNSLDFWLNVTLKDFIIEKYLSSYFQYFESTRYNIKNRMFINLSGKEKLRNERPEIWKEFGLDEI